MLAVTRYDGGEALFIGIAVFLAIVVLVCGIDAWKSAEARNEREPGIWLFLAIVAAVLILLVGCATAWRMAISNGNTKEAYNQLTHQGYHIKELDVRHETITLDPQGCEQQYVLNKHDGIYSVGTYKHGVFVQVKPEQSRAVAQANCPS